MQSRGTAWHDKWPTWEINVLTRETQNQMGGNFQHGRLGQNPHKLCNVIPSLQVNL